jgi:putative ABC transport system ATP-binding protein
LAEEFTRAAAQAGAGQASRSMSESSRPGLSIEGLRFARGDAVVLAIDRFELAAGEHAVVVGPSGCGKTTLLSLIAGLLPLQQGHITVNTDSIGQLTRQGARALDAFRARRIGLVSQQPLLFGMLSALDNLLLARQLAGEQPDRPAATALLAELGLSGLEQRRPAQLSRGQQQRVALARALINRPVLILADEPTANLDDVQAKRAVDLLRARAQASGATLLIATHDARVRGAFETVLALEPL